MGTINQMLLKVQGVDLRAQVPKIVEATSYEITALNQAQLYFGGDSTLTKLTQYKKPWTAVKPGSKPRYAQKKNQMNSKPGLGNPDLFLTGSFYKGMGVVVKGYEYEIKSVDSKAESLEKKYGPQIFGLADQNRSKYATGLFFQSIKAYIESQTGLAFG